MLVLAINLASAVTPRRLATLALLWRQVTPPARSHPACKLTGSHFSVTCSDNGRDERTAPWKKVVIISSEGGIQMNKTAAKPGDRSVSRGVLLAVLFCFFGNTVHASVMSRTISQSMARRLAQQSASKIAVKTQARAGLSSAESAALRSELNKLDAKTLRLLEQRYGQFIPADLLAKARARPARFLDRNAYQRKLTSDYPSVPPAQRIAVVGHQKKGVYVDRNQVLVPRTLAHERIHELSNIGYRLRTGKRMNEGTTEFLAGRVYGQLGIRNMPVGYPEQRRVVEMLASRVGEKRVAQAYFSGKVIPLQRRLDRQLGAGAFDRVMLAMERGNYKTARQILNGQP